MYCYKVISVLIMIIIANTQLNAQIDPRIIIKFHTDNGKPAEGASITLKSLLKESHSNTLITDKFGIIQIEARKERYALFATYIGMNAIVDTITTIDKIDTIHYTFISKTNVLEAVSVTSRKKLLETKDDRFIYNVSLDSSTRLKSVSQILGNLPFVMVDGQGNIQISGQTSFIVLLNGKETSLFAKSITEALRSYPADIVSRIELITSPAARYDAEGVTAIINIITKKFSGYKGFQTLYTSTLTNLSTGLTLTGKKGKIGVTANITSNGTWDFINEYRIIETNPLFASAYLKRTLYGTELAKRLSQNGTIEINYELDSLKSIIAYVSKDKTASNISLRQEVFTLLNIGEIEKGSINNNGSDIMPGVTAGIDYVQKFKNNPKKELAIRINWKGNSNQITNHTIQKYKTIDKWLTNQSDTKNDEYTVQIDAIPIVNEKYIIEAGLKTILRYADANFVSLFTFNLDSSYKEDKNNSNNLRYKQSVYATYGNISTRIKKNNIRLGLRLEQTNIDGSFSNLSQSVKERYLSLIPNFNLTRKVENNKSISLTYNLNLLRPYINTLNPFINNNDSFNISYGNPKLGPQQIHKISAQLRCNKGKLFITTTLSGSWSNNQILSYQIFNPQTGITAITYGNVGQEQITSLGGSINYQFSNKLKAGLWGDLRHVDIRNRFQKQQHKFGYSGIIGHFFSWDASSRFNLSGSGGLDIRNVTLLGRRSPYIFYQINTGYHIIKNKLYATINWNNVHDDYFTIKNYFKDNTVENITTIKRLYRVIFIGLQFTFGKLQEQVGRKKGVVNDDIL